MIPSNSSDGFMLMEVIIAVAVMGLLFAAVFALQTNVTQSVSWITQRFERTIRAKTFLVNSAIKAGGREREEVTFEQRIERPATHLRYQKSKVPDAAPFAQLTNLFKQKVTLTWQEAGTTRHDTMVMFVYQPKEPSSKGTPELPKVRPS